MKQAFIAIGTKYVQVNFYKQPSKDMYEDQKKKTLVAPVTSKLSYFSDDIYLPA